MSWLKIGIDFDNTIACYDEVFSSAAKERGYIEDKFKGPKKEVKDKIRKLSDGEKKWQELQGFVYGKGIMSAKIFDGFEEFLRNAENQSAEIKIISHKTKFGHYDNDKTNLRTSALNWMVAKQLFYPYTKLYRENVVFCESLDEKIRVINSNNLGFFIDDLPKVLAHEDFSPLTKKILFSPGTRSRDLICSSDQFIFRSWLEVSDFIFKSI